MPTAHDLLTTYRAECWGDDPEQGALEAAEHQRDTWAKTATEIRARIAARQDERDRSLLLALHVKLDPDGCPVPRQGAPRGSRQRPADPPPAMQAVEEPGAATEAFFAALSDRAPAAELEALGWHDGAVGLSDLQTRVVVKHQIVPDEVAGFVVGGVVVAHKTWTMLDDARVVA